MDPTPNSPSGTGAPPTAPQGVTSGTKSRARSLGARIAIGVVIALLVLVAVDWATARPGVCSACHEMQPRATSWSKSAHATVVCVSCHQPATKWYQLPQRLAGRTALLGRCSWWKVGGQSPQAATKSRVRTALVANDNCLQCHDPDRKATSGFRILIDHAEHAERNKSCLSCHVNTAHPEAQRSRALSLMDQCFTCHGKPDKPEASADCRVCHPREYDLKPASHKVPAWAKAHGRVATSDREQCDLCHKPSFCMSCHGLEMPHPSTWVSGTPNHSAVAKSQRQLCEKCHTEKPDLCSMCHHKDYDPTKGTWIKQHPTYVSKRGASSCIDCHNPLDCVYCHSTSTIMRGAVKP